MDRLSIKSHKSVLSRGDLKAVVSCNSLLLPKDLITELTKLGVRTPEGVLSAMEGSPAWICKLLGWTPQEVESAVSLLKTQLRGFVDAHYLDPEKRVRPRVRLGARPPVPRSKI